MSQGGLLSGLDGFTICDMPTKGTKVVAIRVPDSVFEAIQAEADERQMSVNHLLNLQLAADFSRGSGVQKVTRTGRKSDTIEYEDEN